MTRDRDRQFRREMRAHHDTASRKPATPSNESRYRRSALNQVRKLDVDMDATLDMLLLDRRQA